MTACLMCLMCLMYVQLRGYLLPKQRRAWYNYGGIQKEAQCGGTHGLQTRWNGDVLADVAVSSLILRIDWLSIRVPLISERVVYSIADIYRKVNNLPRWKHEKCARLDTLQPLALSHRPPRHTRQRKGVFLWKNTKSGITTNTAAPITTRILTSA